MTTPRVIGVDLSLASAGIATPLERIWFSPHCLDADEALTLFGGAA